MKGREEKWKVGRFVSNTKYHTSRRKKEVRIVNGHCSARKQSANANSRLLATISTGPP